MANLRLALRTLTKTPFTTSVAVVSLALGIGANAAIFSLFDQMLLRALPVEEPERLVNLAAPGPMPGSTSCNQGLVAAGLQSSISRQKPYNSQLAFSLGKASKLPELSC